MKIDLDLHNKKKATMAALETERRPFWNHWREIADYYLPRRYVWLLSETEQSRNITKNSFILDATGTTSARTLASGMMNGITSPSRPWFKLRPAGFGDELAYDVRVWLDEVQRRMLLAMAETNFYNSMALLYLDLVLFGTASCLIYEDFESVFRCYNCALGEYYLAQSSRQQVNTFAREFVYKVHQVVEEWGIDNCSERVRTAWQAGGARLQENVGITHLIEPNDKRDGQLKGNFDIREYYWETSAPVGEVLSIKGYHEMPGIHPRWELLANDSYGTGPGMDGLPDVIQLQHETKSKGQGLDKMISPPMVADVQLEHRPTALMPRGITFVAGTNNVGIKPAYQLNLPLDMLSADIADVRIRIREIFHNDLFKMISQLETVRSATEIDARREEKLVLLGPVLERFENEALDPAIKRIFAIMMRADLLPAPPEALLDVDLEIQYVSILTSAQTAVATIPTERFVGFVGNIASVHPKALNIPNWDQLIRNYGRDLGVRTEDINSREDVEAMNQEADELAASREAAATGEVLVDSAKTLSETQVGGGANALQRLMNPYSTAGP